MVIEAPGSAGRLLASNVVHLDPAPAVFTAMKDGWARQQSARFLREQTIDSRLRLMDRVAGFTGLYPWQWTPAEGEAFIAGLRSGATPIRLSTARSYEVTISLFVEYLRDPRYGWAQVCLDRFGEAPRAVFHESNSVVHTAEYEGDPRRRPLTYDEVQALFDAADARPKRVRGQGRKGALTTLRDAAMLKTTYAFGTRRTESSKLDLVDLRRNRKAPQFGSFGMMTVRYGRSSGGGPAKRRKVLTIPEMDWIVDVLGEWVGELRPHFSPGSHPALWVTERVGRLSPRSINEAFVVARQDAGLDENLDLHCLRHSYVTHLTEFGYPARFVQEQVGHSHAATTAIYMGVSDEYRNTLLENSLKRRLGPQMIKKMGYDWRLRQVMAEHDMFHTSDLVPLLAERGVTLSREQVYRLVTQPPQRMSMDTLVALCDIFECTPNDLIKPAVVNLQTKKTADGGVGSVVPLAGRRTVIRRPGQS